jgi:ankyrin repeat protein
LHHAAWVGNEDIVKLFLSDKRINPMAVNNQRNTCLHEAARLSYENIVELHVDDPRINPMAINNDGNTYLDDL